MSEKRQVSPIPLDSSLPSSPLHTSPPWSLSIKVIVAVTILLLTVLIIWRFQSLLPTLVMASILAYLLNPLVNLGTIRFNLTRGMSVALVYILLLLIAIGGGIGLGFLAFEQASSLTTDFLPDSLEDAAALVQAQVNTLTAFTVNIGPYSFSLASLPTSLNLQELVQQGVEILRPVFSRSGTFAAHLAQATISTLSLIFLVIVISIYLVKDAPKLWETISDLAHQPGYRQDAERLIADFTRIWDAYLRGQVILGLVIGAIVSLVLSLLGVRYALGLGVLSGVLEFLPIIGPLVGTGSAVLVALFQSDTIWGLPSYQYALLIAVVMGLIQGLENNILVPRIVGDALDLHPLLVMISVIMGASLAGILGAVLAAPVVATIKLLGSYAWRKMLDLPPFPEPAPAPPASSKDFWQRLAQLRGRFAGTAAQLPPEQLSPSTKIPNDATTRPGAARRERQKRTKTKR
ncbi:MAG: AI-2E family transporter [Caldilineaceae bacterium]|nr:AI-2E family transporter [Caldilineaceae bacterium]